MQDLDWKFAVLSHKFSLSPLLSPKFCPADLCLSNINNIHSRQPHHDIVHSLTVTTADSKDMSL